MHHVDLNGTLLCQLYYTCLDKYVIDDVNDDIDEHRKTFVQSILLVFWNTARHKQDAQHYSKLINI